MIVQGDTPAGLQLIVFSQNSNVPYKVLLLWSALIIFGVTSEPGLVQLYLLSDMYYLHQA